MNSADGQRPYTTLLRAYKERCTTDKGLTDQNLLELFGEILLTGKQKYMENLMQMWSLQHREQTLDNLIWTDKWMKTLVLLKILNFQSFNFSKIRPKCSSGYVEIYFKSTTFCLNLNFLS